MKTMHRCPLCDESYDGSDLKISKIHEHPEPQSGLARDLWLASRMEYESWIELTNVGRIWDDSTNADKATGRVDNMIKEVLDAQELCFYKKNTLKKPDIIRSVNILTNGPSKVGGRQNFDG